MTEVPAAYLDASAFIKLVAAEPETPALETELEQWSELASSELLEVEAGRFRQRYGGDVANAIELGLGQMTLIPIGSEVRSVAATVRPARVRSLDAIHLATALSLGSRLGVLFAYDRRLLEAAEQNGLRTLAPA